MNPLNLRVDVLQEPDLFKLKEVVNVALEHCKYQVTSLNFLDKNEDGYTAILTFDISYNPEGVKIKR